MVGLVQPDEGMLVLPPLTRAMESLKNGRFSE
jgi:hypothetical protein